MEALQLEHDQAPTYTAGKKRNNTLEDSQPFEGGPMLFARNLDPKFKDLRPVGPQNLSHMAFPRPAWFLRGLGFQDLGTKVWALDCRV